MANDSGNGEMASIKWPIHASAGVGIKRIQVATIAKDSIFAPEPLTWRGEFTVTARAFDFFDLNLFWNNILGGCAFDIHFD